MRLAGALWLPFYEHGKLSAAVRREVLGLDDPAQAERQLYTGQWNTLRNYFCPVMKLAGKERDGGHVTRRYDAAQTQRLIASGKLPAAKQRELEQTLAKLNPLALKQELERNLAAVLRHSSVSSSCEATKP